MNRWNPCPRNVFLRRLRTLGFVGPYSGSKHQFMVFGDRRLTVPSNDEYSVPQLKMMIREIETILERKVPASEWNEL